MALLKFKLISSPIFALQVIVDTLYFEKYIFYFNKNYYFSISERLDIINNSLFKDLKLNIVGLMCIPPLQGDPSQYFKNLAELAKINNLSELSMGMSNDYECAIKNGSTFVRIGSKIFTQD